MMKLFLLAALLFIGTHGAITYKYCASTADCSGDCQTTTAPTGCQSTSGTGIGIEITCSSNTITYASYASEDCSGDATASVDYPSGDCEVLGTGSFSYTCADNANSLKLGFVAVLVLIASLF
mmetsp:Transcript_10623/g.9604  ORF Transcript_10623/g.9604 Transcript_10623/m.9604 type:complete len:122 (-) Transcript_10623:4-369(-)